LSYYTTMMNQAKQGHLKRARESRLRLDGFDFFIGTIKRRMDLIFTISSKTTSTTQIQHTLMLKPTLRPNHLEATSGRIQEFFKKATTGKRRKRGWSPS